MLRSEVSGEVIRESCGPVKMLNQFIAVMIKCYQNRLFPGTIPLVLTHETEIEYTIQMRWFLLT